MTEKEKVIRGLECIAQQPQNGTCGECAYFRPFRDDPDCGWCDKVAIANDALALLREQEVGKWIKLQGMAPPEYHGHKICSVCESFAPYDPIHPWREMLSPYCPGCGAKMEVSGDAAD